MNKNKTIGELIDEARKKSGEPDYPGHDIMALERFSGGVSSTDIVILSPKRLSNSILSTTDSLCNLEIIERNSIDEFGKRRLNYFTVQSF